MPSPLGSWGAYGLGMAALAVFSVVKLLLSSLLDVEFTALIFAPAILIAASLGGLAPGIFTTLVSVPLIMVLTQGVERPGIIDLLLFGLVGFGIAWLGGSLRDARQRAEQTSSLLQRRETYLQSILDSISDATIAMRANGEIISFNTAAEKLFGYREKDILNRNIAILVSTQSGSGRHSFLGTRSGRGKIGGMPSMGSAIGLRSDGSTFTMGVETVRSVSGDEVIVTALVRDITEHQRAASELEAAQLEVSRLSRLNEMGEMTSALAHEINQPLAAIANYVQGSRRMLDRFEPSLLPQLRESLNHASGQALRAGEIIHRLRDFVTRGETGKEIVDLEQLVRDGAATAMAGTKDTTFALQLALSGEQVNVLVDSIQIQQVIGNLVRNAADAVLTQLVREVVISTRVDGEEALVEISDTGHGIAPELRATIFQPFVTSKSHGMGIGLSISKRIIESHGGTISAHARPGGGTILRFSLPVVHQEDYVDEY